MPGWTPDDIARMLVNPFYAITIAAPLVGRRSASMVVEGVSDWLAHNAAALGTPIGDGHEAEEVWLWHLLEVLRTDAAAADPANPARAIAIAPIFAEEHPPLVTEAQWVASNGKLVRELGAHAWLETLLRVLQGDYVTAEVDDDPEVEEEGDATDGTDPRQRPPSRIGRSAHRDPHAKRGGKGHRGRRH